MCRECYEDYDSPPIESDAEREAADAIEEVYTFEPAGGIFHIVFDDWNIEDHYIDWCLGPEAGAGYHAEADPEEWALQIYAGLLFRQLSERQRAAVQGEVDRRLGVF